MLSSHIALCTCQSKVLCLVESFGQNPLVSNKLFIPVEPDVISRQTSVKGSDWCIRVEDEKYGTPSHQSHRSTYLVTSQHHSLMSSFLSYCSSTASNKTPIGIWNEIVKLPNMMERSFGTGYVLSLMSIASTQIAQRFLTAMASRPLTNLPPAGANHCRHQHPKQNEAAIRFHSCLSAKDKQKYQNAAIYALRSGVKYSQ